MKFLDLSLPTPAENLALDESLLEAAEEGSGPAEILRLWESPTPFVVLGRSSRVAVEVQVDACQRAGIPVLRRCSGGAAVVAGPGCLMYGVVLSYARHPELRILEQAHRFVLSTVATALASFSPAVEMLGTSDLAVGDRKFSGNSLRCKRDHLLYHGTLLHQFPLELIGRYLGTPPRQPEYRRQRDHTSFVSNFPAPVTSLRTAIRNAWGADETWDDWSRPAVAALVAERYSQDSWNYRL